MEPVCPFFQSSLPLQGHIFRFRVNVQFQFSCDFSWVVPGNPPGFAKFLNQQQNPPKNTKKSNVVWLCTPTLDGTIFGSAKPPNFQLPTNIESFFLSVEVYFSMIICTFAVSTPHRKNRFHGHQNVPQSENFSCT